MASAGARQGHGSLVASFTQDPAQPELRRNIADIERCDFRAPQPTSPHDVEGIGGDEEDLLFRPSHGSEGKLVDLGRRFVDLDRVHAQHSVKLGRSPAWYNPIRSILGLQFDRMPSG